MDGRYWFKPHKTGFVLYPIKWQGWTVVLLYFAGLIYSFIQADAHSHSVSDTFFSFLPGFFIFSALLIIVSYLKGKPPVVNEKIKE